MDVPSFLQQPLLVIWPQGGQRTARRNALMAANDHRVAATERAAGQAALDRANLANARALGLPVSSAHG